MLRKAWNFVAELGEAVNRKWPEPYLRVPFEVDASGLAPVLAGWNYRQVDIAEHGIKDHGAIDWELPIGTPVLAAADGYAVAFWDERWIPLEEAGQQKTFGQGLTIQIWHGNGRYTQYGHLSALPQDVGREPHIPFYPSEPDEDGNCFPHEIRNALVREYRSVKVARWVKAGDVIGYVGTTGGALGKMGYEPWWERHQGVIPRPPDPPTYIPPQLHFVEFRRRLRSRVAERRDPFGIYGTAEQYPDEVRRWSQSTDAQRHPPLWLPQ